MENVLESWTRDDFRDVGTLNAWKEASAKHAGDEERLSKALEMLRTVSRDNSRTPVQWDDRPNAGFCPEGVKPWIKVHENYTEVNVAAAQNDPDSMLAMWSRVLKLRKEYREVLVYGSFEIYDMEDPKVFTYVKSFKAISVLVLLNFSSEEHDLKVPLRPKGKDMELLVANVSQVGEKLSA